MSDDRTRDLLRRSLGEVKRLRAELARRDAAAHGPIAIVGMDCRAPGGVDDPDSLWDLLMNRGDAIAPSTRWSGRAVFAGGFLDRIDRFDAGLFGITPREAIAMAPEQRILLEVVWRALEHAGFAPMSLRGSETGVYIGGSVTDYGHPGDSADAGDGYALTGLLPSVLSGRLAYVLGLEGPALTIDTACSASLVALHQACVALRRGECDLALAGGVQVMSSPAAAEHFARLQVNARDGRCKAFGAGADGAGWAEGCGVVVLERLADALAAGRRPIAIIRGTAVNQDGRSQGLTAPNGPSQQRVIRRALADARLTPADIDAIEAHGTGTPLGDPIEAGALDAVFSGSPRPVWLGSIKSNIGHTQTAAGVLGVIKMTLGLERERLPSTLHADPPSTHIPWANSPLALLDEARPWPRSTERVRRAGISSFGISGTNAHLVLEEAPLDDRTKAGTQADASLDDPRGPAPILLSAGDEDGLRRQARRWHDRLRRALEDGAADIRAIARSSIARGGLPWRASMVVDGPAHLLETLHALAENEPHPAVTSGRAAAVDTVVFVMPGQGGQWAGMGRPLIERLPVFAATIDACDAALAPELGWSVRAVLSDEPAAPSLDRVDVVQPCLFAMSVAFAETWRALGVEPDVVIGHSQGEIAAAVVAGHLSLVDGARVVTRRSRLLARQAPAGAMVVVDESAEVVERMMASAPWGRELSVAVVNTAASTVLSGDVQAAERLVEELAEQGRVARRVDVDYASHSAHMDPLLPALRASLADLTPRHGAVRMISSTTAETLDGTRLGAQYWCDNLRSTVRFDRAVAAVGGRRRAFVECGPHPVLALPLSALVGRGDQVVASGRRGAPDMRPLLSAVARLHIGGLPVRWAQLVGDGVRAELPTYAFRPQRFWRGGAEPAATVTPASRNEGPMSDERTQNVRRVIMTAVAQATGLATADVDPEAGLMAMGVDSLMFMQVKDRVARRYDVDLPNALFFEAGTSANTLAAFVAGRLPAPAEEAPRPAGAPPDAASAPMTSVAALMAEQMRAMSELARRQLETLQHLGADAPGIAEPQASIAEHDPLPEAAAATPQETATERAGGPVFRPYRSIQRESGAEGNYLADMVFAFNAATPTSKARTQADRFVFANNRNIAGFTPATKEMTYQIIADRARGGHVWDLDGHQYVDLTQGFGSSLLGHGHPRLTDAIRRQLDRTWAVGPVSDDASTVARQVCEMTGAERVAFYNSGTEAVMVSIRLARTATGRAKVVFFEGAYHGMFDGLMAIPRRGALPGAAAPMAPGVPESMVADTLVLRYDDPESLRIIEERGHEIAGVLVESVQSRRPDCQPRAFLHRLRALTQRIGAALIFDEVVTGFRTAPGGAQAWFGVKADLAAYGKVAGGAMPVGIVAGQAAFLDGVDGGMWRFGDDSMPEKTNTFVAGTFCSHPLTMASARAMLEHLAEQGPSLQRGLNGRTRRLCTRLNQVFAEAGLPLHTVPFGSLFRYVVPRGYEMLYNRLLVERVYIWEGRNCFLATAHDGDDIDHIVTATRASAAWLAQHVAAEAPPAPAGFGVEHLPVSAAQASMYRRSQRPGSGRAYHVPAALVIDGPLDVERFEPALTELTARHEALRTSFHHDGERLWQRVHPFGDFDLRIDEDAIDEDAIDGFVDDIIRPFDVSSPVMLRVGVARLGPERHLVALDAHHLAVDGLSAHLLVDELLRLLQNQVLDAAPVQYRDYVEWQRAYFESPALKQDEAEWCELLADLPPRVELPRSVDDAATRPSFRCARAWSELSEPTALRALSRGQGVTLNVMLHALFQIWLGLISHRTHVFYGSPTGGRPDGGFGTTLGLFIGVAVYRARLDDDLRFTELLTRTREATGRLMRLQNVPFERVLPLMADAGDGSTPFEVGLNYESGMGPSTVGALTATPLTVTEPGMSLSCVVDVRDYGDTLRLAVVHDPERYRLDRADAWARLFDAIAQRVVAEPEITIAALRREMLASGGPLTEST